MGELDRVQEPGVRAGGGAAQGYFEVTDDVTGWTRAAFLDRVGRRTPVFCRFTTLAAGPGAARDPRGFAVRFHTEDGDYDLVGSSTPVFFIRDPQRFSGLVCAQRRCPGTDLRDHEVQWDFWTRTPESAHQVTLLMTDRGTPRTWRHMNGYGGHTFMWVNRGGERFWIKYTLRTDQGIENLTGAEAAALCAEEPGFHARDLHGSIGGGDPPSWTLYVQVMEYDDAPGYRFNPFDLTKVWPHRDHPPIRVGRLVLDRNPGAGEAEEAPFAPANMVPGIGPSPDPMLQGRLFSYPDPHRFRLGPNHPRPAEPLDAEMVRAASVLHAEDDDLVQPRALWERVLSPTDREHLVRNIVAHAGTGLTSPTRRRVVDYWAGVHPDLGAGVAAGLEVEPSLAGEAR